MDENPKQYLKGRGAQINTHNPFDKLVYDGQPQLPEGGTQIRTQYIEVHAKTILNKVKSPDIPGEYSMNPYQGCEHGCVYCYARNTHTYWSMSAGLDFEQKILVKVDAPELLEQQLGKKSHKASPIMFSGNTDCYQPAEQKYQLTRRMLEVLWKHRHPAGIITKNSLVLRDLDLLGPMAENRLARVAVSLTTMNEGLRQMLEPRTASIGQRLKTIKTLSENGIPVTAMLAPIIPGLNDHEIMKLAQAAAEHGASGIGSTVVRLNGDVAEIFEDWVRKAYPDRADKVLNQIRECHGGQLNDSRFGKRMSGEGKMAEMISKQLKIARKLHFAGKCAPPYDLELYERYKNPQLRLF